MILNIDRFKAKLLSPLSVINATFVVYGGMAILQIGNQDILLDSFSPVANDMAGYQIVCMLIFFIYINVLYKLAKPISQLFPVVLVSPAIYKIIIASYCVFFCLIIYLFNDKYLYIDYIIAIFSSDSLVEAALIIAEFGYDLVNDGGLLYYTILYSLPIFFFSLSFETTSKSIKIFLILLSMAAILVYGLAGRREVFLFIPIFVLINARPDRKFILKVVLMLSVLLVLSVALLMARLKAVGFDMSQYLGSQEFLPYTYGSYLVLHQLNWFDLDEVRRLSPLYVLFGDYNLSFYTRIKYFGSTENGPTVTLLYPIVAFFPLSSVMFAFILGFMKRIHNRIFIQNNYSGSSFCLYVFLLVKLFTLTRNGEFGLFIWDLLIYLVVIGPLIVLKKGVS